MNINFVMDLEEYQQFIVDAEQTLSEQGKADFCKNAQWLYEKMGPDVAKLAIMLITNSQIRDYFARKPN